MKGSPSKVEEGEKVVPAVSGGGGWGGGRGEDGSYDREQLPKAISVPGSWAALNGPVSVALFENSLQMETRDPFDPDPGSGLRAEFSCGK